MKNMYLMVALALSVACVGKIWAESDPKKTESDVVKVEGGNIVIDTQGLQNNDNEVSMSVKINADEDMEPEEKLVQVVRKIAGKEAAEELRAELSGLDEEQREELERVLSEGIVIEGGDIPDGVVPIALFAIFMIFGLPLLILLAVLFFAARKRRQKMAIIQAYLDAGQDVPHQVLSVFDQDTSTFKSGLILTAVGIGIVAAFNAANNSSVGALGLIPMFLGIAKLVYWFFEERKHTKA